jgi:hypothetical protein
MDSNIYILQSEKQGLNAGQNWRTWAENAGGAYTRGHTCGTLQYFFYVSGQVLNSLEQLFLFTLPDPVEDSSKCILSLQ